MITKEKIDEIIEEHKEEIINDISRLVRINSIRDVSTKYENAPFGVGIRQVFDEFIKIANEKNFKVKDFDGYALEISYGDFEEYVAMLTHLDVVDIVSPNLWKSDPFELYNDGEFLYARGINDDKGPTILSLYALYLAKMLDFPIKRSIKLIVGGAEETTWECMDYYFSKNKQPIMGFSPDADFPIVNGEKGILVVKFDFSDLRDDFTSPFLKIIPKTTENFVCYELDITVDLEYYNKNRDYLTAKLVAIDNDTAHIKYMGKSSLSRNPHRGTNAIDLFVDDIKKIKEFDLNKCPLLNFYSKYLFDDNVGKLLGIYNEDFEMGHSSCCPTALYIDEGNAYINVDIRYTKAIEKDILKSRLRAIKDFKVIRDKKLLYVESDSPLIKGLSDAYERYTGEKAKLFTKGGASYARVLDNGIAFGPTFEGDSPNPHGPNENLRIDTMYKALGIYLFSIYNLTCCDDFN